MVMECLGAEVTLDEGYVKAVAPSGLRGGEINFPLVSVGATENALMAAALPTVRRSSPMPPVSLRSAILLNVSMPWGRRSAVTAPRPLPFEGVDALQGCRHSVIADRIEAGTFAIAAAMTCGHVTLEGCRGDHLDALFAVMAETGTDQPQWRRDHHQADAVPRPADITTEPYPGFPTDLQAQFMAMMCLADGDSRISETILKTASCMCRS